MLRIDELSVSFGGVRAVDAVTLELPDHAVLGLVGPNGSGKSTLLNAICGLVPARGRVVFDGASVQLGRPVAVRRAGILRTFQTPQTLPGLTCLENVLIADGDRRGRGLCGATLGRVGMARRERARWMRAERALERVGLERYSGVPAGALSYGRGRLLELARVIAAAPRVVLLDEPTAGLNEDETAEFGDLLASVGSDGATLLVVDHKIDFLDRLCDSLVVLELGRVIAMGTPANVWADERVIDAYLGGGDDAVG